MDLALNKQQWLICHKTKPNQILLRTRLARNYWRSNIKLISDVFLEAPSHGRASVERPARNFLCRHRMLPRRPAESDGR